MVSSDERNSCFAIHPFSRRSAWRSWRSLGWIFDSGGAGGFLDRAFAGGAGEGSWKRVRLNKKTLPRESVCQYVCKGWVRHGPASEDGKRQPTPMLKTWVTDLARGVVMS